MLEDSVLHLENAHPASKVDELLALLGRQTLGAARSDIVLLHPAAQTRLTDPQARRDPRNRLPVTCQIQCSTPKLRRLRLRHHSASVDVR